MIVKDLGLMPSQSIAELITIFFLFSKETRIQLFFFCLETFPFKMVRTAADEQCYYYGLQCI